MMLQYIAHAWFYSTVKVAINVVATCIVIYFAVCVCVHILQLAS
jgi:hypothetical protein